MSEQPESHLIKQTAASNLQAGRDINFYGDINQTVFSVNIPQTNSLRTPYREVFKPLIEKRLTLFGGRNTTLTQIAEFIKKLPSGYLVITAPAGFGKTSLMAKLVSEAPETFAYHFFAPYENFSSVTEEGFLRNVVEQMAQWHNCTDTFPEKLPDLQAQYHYFFDKPLEHIHVLVIDGLDEVTNWKLIPYLSRRLPENLHIILTVRDVGQDWAADYDLPNDQIEHLPLAGLTRNDVVQVMQEAGKKAIIFAENPMLLDEVMRVSAYHKEPSLGADPFYVRLLAEDASDGRLTHDNIATQPTGLESYLDRWWQDIKRLAGEQRTKDLFGTLIAALGAINRQDLEIINDTLVDDWATDFFDDVLKQVRRFVIGNEDCGYAIAHPRLRQYMRTKIRIDAYNRKLLDFCGSWQKHHSFYALTQVEIGEIKAGQDSFKEAISLVSKITDQSKQANLIVALADALAEVNFFDQAFDILKKINEQNNKVLLLIAKAKLYIKSNQIEKSQICFAEVQQVIYDIENKFNQEDALLKLAEAQLELKDTSAALKTVENIDNYLDKSNILIKIVKLHIEENNFPDALVIANLIKSSPNKANSLLMIAQAQIQSNPYTDDGIITAKMINLESWKEDALVQIAKIQARAGNFSGAVKTVCLINNETKKEYAISTIANVYALAKNYDVAKEMAGNICETSCQIETLGSIAKIEVDRNYTHTGISTFANALQAAKNTNAGTRFLSTLILLKIADLQIKTQQIKSGIAIIKFVNQITKNTYILREETVILTLVAEVLGKAGDIQKALLTLDTAIEITQKMTIQVERVFSFTDIAKAQAKLGDFNLAKQTAEKIEVPSNKAEILTFISKEQALKGMKEESQTTLCSAIEIMDTLGFEEEWIHVGCLVAVAEGIIDREEAQATFNTLLNVAQASSNKARNLQIIAVALTEFEDIFKALTIVAEIQDVKEQVEALWAIGWKQFKKGEKVTILAIALEAKNEIKDEKHLSQILKRIAQIQVIAGEGLQAIKTLEGILIDLNWHLTGIASLFVETADKANFQKLLIPCAYRLDTAYEICGHIARMYPKQAQVVAEVIIEFNSVSYTNKSES